MPQITIYLPAQIAERVKKKAKSLRKTLSAYLSDLARKDTQPAKWPKSFVDLYGSTKGDLQKPEKLVPEHRDEF